MSAFDQPTQVGAIPLISIVIPVYNGAVYIEKTIRSVLAQTIQEIEVLVINDASKDNSEEVIRQLQTEDSRVRLITKPNSGVADSRNKGIELAKGKYVALLDQDDVWEPANLEEKINAISKSGQNWAFSNISYIDADGKLLEKEDQLVRDDFYRNLLKWENVIPAPSGNIVVLREFLGADIRYDVRIPYPSDRDFCVQLARKGEPVFVDKKLWRYRIHGESMSVVNKRIVIEMEKMYDKYRKEDYFPDTKTKRVALSRVYLMMAGICIRFTKERYKGFLYMLRSFRHSPKFFLKTMFGKFRRPATI